MRINITELWDSLKQVLSPERVNNDCDRELTQRETTDCEIYQIAPERIKRSPGHHNLSELNDEPEWYHE
jgi:hypothetical protein